MTFSKLLFVQVNNSDQIFEAQKELDLLKQLKRFENFKLQDGDADWQVIHDRLLQRRKKFDSVCTHICFCFFEILIYPQPE